MFLTGRPVHAARLDFGVAVTVTSIARYVCNCLGVGISCNPISAGQSVGSEGIRFGGSSWVSCCVSVMLASGAMICNTWNSVLRMVLWSGILDAWVHEKK